MPLCVITNMINPVPVRASPASKLVNRSATILGLSPPGGRKSRPAFLQLAHGGGRAGSQPVKRATLEARPRPSPPVGHRPADRRSPAARPSRRARLQRAGDAGRTGEALCGSRHGGRPCARPRALSGMSVRPWMRPSSFQLGAGMPDQADAHARTRMLASASIILARAGARSCRGQYPGLRRRSHGPAPRRVTEQGAHGRGQRRG